MSTLKTVTSALTAAILVSGIGLAVAQTEDQKQPTEPVAAATAAPLSEQTPADPNAAPAVDTTAAMAEQQQPADDPAKVTPPVDSTAAMPSTTTTDTTTTTTTTTPSYDQPATPAPRADRH